MAKLLEEVTFENYFKNYNFHLYSLSFYPKLIAESEARTKLIQDYWKKLHFKNQIDTIFNRKDELKKNKTLIDEAIALAEKNKITLKVIKDAKSNITPEMPIDSDSEAYTSYCQAQVTYMNRHRLDGVWARNMTDTLLGLGLVHNENLKQLSSQVALINGFTSYGFYFFRGGLDVLKLLKHTFTSYDELKQKKITTYDKLRLQMGLRYSTIINDIVLWGPVNYTTYHVLTGNNSLGYYGNVLTLGLLFGDFAHAVFNYYHQNKKYEFFVKQINSLALSPEEKTKILQEAEAIHKKNQFRIMLDIIYTAALCLSFLVLCNFLSPSADGAPLYAPGPLLVGSSVILFMQIIYNLKDFILKYMDAQDETTKKIALIEGSTRLFIQLMMPGIFIASSYLMTMTSALPTWFFTVSALAVSKLLIDLIQSISKHYVLQTKQNGNSDKKEDPEIKKEMMKNHYEMNINLVHLISGASGITFIGMAIGFSQTIGGFLAIPAIITALGIYISEELKKEAKQEEDSSDLSSLHPKST